jgi:hypothetical protein
MKIGKVGYKVVCNNKNIDKNQLTISLLGFEENRNDIELDVKGKVLAAEVDDVNNDGFRICCCTFLLMLKNERELFLQ